MTRTYLLAAAITGARWLIFAGSGRTSRIQEIRAFWSCWCFGMVDLCCWSETKGDSSLYYSPTAAHFSRASGVVLLTVGDIWALQESVQRRKVNQREDMLPTPLATSTAMCKINKTWTHWITIPESISSYPASFNFEKKWQCCKTEWKYKHFSMFFLITTERGRTLSRAVARIIWSLALG